MPTKTYTRKQIIKDICVLENGKILHLPHPDHGKDRMWDGEKWVPIPAKPVITVGACFDGREPHRSEIAELTKLGGIPAK